MFPCAFTVLKVTGSIVPILWRRGYPMAHFDKLPCYSFPLKLPVNEQIEGAHTLASRFYTDPAILEIQKDEIFSRIPHSTQQLTLRRQIGSNGINKLTIYNANHPVRSCFMKLAPHPAFTHRLNHPPSPCPLPLYTPSRSPLTFFTLYKNCPKKSKIPALSFQSLTDSLSTLFQSCRNKFFVCYIFKKCVGYPAFATKSALYCRFARRFSIFRLPISRFHRRGSLAVLLYLLYLIYFLYLLS